ncbi:MAG: hypothetical protein LUQ38_11105 [Methanotrichaceae archaeon]|nr:hypothetical protein [Methanotrichaceae archaeon]
MLYEDSQEIVEYISQAMKQVAHDATVMLFSPGLIPSLGIWLKVQIEYSTPKTDRGKHQD